jgi:hypothetical protein
MPDVPPIASDQDLQNDIMRRTHALLVAYVKHEPNTLLVQLMHEIAAMDEHAGVVALASAGLTVRTALEAADRIAPGFSDFFLASIGEMLAAP